MQHTDICIAGAGVIGLSIALELHARGLSVTVVERGQPLREASWAAAGMLAAQDPHNPAELAALSDLSISLYPYFLSTLVSLGGLPVPFQTSRTLQSIQVPGASHAPLNSDSLFFDLAGPPPSPLGFQLLHERSIDPRQLGTALQAAATRAPIRFLFEDPIVSTQAASGSVRIKTQTSTIEAKHFVDCTGAWTGNRDYRVVPIKGQMLAVALPSNFPLNISVRTADIYIVPRTTGPMAGRAVIGATVEDVGFDRTIHTAQIEQLRQQAIALLPQLADAEVVDSWSGLRPATPDRLPILGAHPQLRNHWIASGHYRNGILLAPATAHVMAQLILGELTAVPLEPFSPSRVALQETCAAECE